VSAWGVEDSRRDAWPTARQADLLRSALLPDARAIEAWHRVRPEVELERLDGGVAGVLPQLRRNLVALGVSDPLLPLFKGVERHTWARNQMLWSHATPAVAMLEASGIPTLLLKGSALFSGNGPSAGTRLLGDLDILVPPEQTSDAARVLRAAGFEPLGAAGLISHGYEEAAGWQVDLHWYATNSARRPGADADLWQAAVPVALQGVPTRRPCPADELLIVLCHGQRWHGEPSYRWAVDAALIARGDCGPLDWERLLGAARERRVCLTVARGLEFLREVASSPVPEWMLRELGHGTAVDRLERRAELKQPRRRGRLELLALRYRQVERSTGAHGARAAVTLLRGSRPGPGRPLSTMAVVAEPGDASIGVPLQIGERLSFGGELPAHVVHGMWRAERDGAWVAGREARLRLPLAAPAAGALVLRLWLDALVAPWARGQRLSLAVAGTPVGSFELNPWRGRLEGEPVLLPAELVAGRDQLELVLRTPDAVSPARRGAADDDRLLSVFLRELELSDPQPCRPGETFMLGSAGNGQSTLAGGWSEGEADGRWTCAARADIALRLDSALEPGEELALELEGFPFVPQPGTQLHIELLANGRRVARTRFTNATVNTTARSHTLRPGTVGPARDLILSWCICGARSPAELGISDDRRKLGFFLRRLTVTPTSSAMQCGRSGPGVFR